MDYTKYAPLNVSNITAKDYEIAQAILSDNNQFRLHYLRHARQVALSVRPVRNADGAVLENVDWVRKPVVAKGCPRAAMIAFLHEGDLYIGWSSRDERHENLPYSKKGGRVAAILRGLKDTINFNEDHVLSACSTVIPKHIAKRLPQFIRNAETTFDTKAVNVGYPELLPTKAESKAITTSPIAPNEADAPIEVEMISFTCTQT